jgi:hypothetical protein
VTCEEAIRAIDAMLDREIDDGERLQLEAHLAGCEACRRETDERRALSDRIARDLNEAFRATAPAAPRIVVRTRRFPWARAAAVILAGVAIGFIGNSTGFFTPSNAEAREVAGLSALKEAYETRDRELMSRLEQEAGDLDRRAARAPEGPVRDLAAMYVMNGAAGLAGSEPLALPPEPAARARTLACRMSSQDWSQRGQAVLALRRLAAADAPHVNNQITLLSGTNATFANLWVKSVQAPTEPAVTVEIDGGNLRVTQFRDARFRIESTAAAAPRIYEGISLLEFRTRYPELVERLRIRGVDGNFTVAGVHCTAPDVERSPAVYVPAVVWSAPSAESGAIAEALSVQVVMANCAEAGRPIAEAEKKGLEVMRRVQEVPALRRAVSADPERVRSYLAALRKVDKERLALARERLNDELAELERRVAAWERRIECVRKAAVALEYLPR